MFFVWETAIIEKAYVGVVIMGQYRGDLDQLGKMIEDIVDKAVSSQDYQKLNQTVRQTVDRAMDFGTETFRKVSDTVSNTVSSTAAFQAAKKAKEPPKVVLEQKNLPALYSNGNKQTAFGILRIVGGSILSVFSFLGGAAAGVMGLVMGSGFFSVPVGIALGGCGVGVWLLSGGIREVNRMGRFKAYRRALGEKTHCTLEKLARSVGKSRKFVRREVERMIHQGLFLEGHLDREETMLITSDETYQNFEESRLMLLERQKREAEEKARKEAIGKQAQPVSQDAQVREVLDRGNAFIAEIRRCNDAIPGEEISGKIYRMETIVRKIFQRAEEHPEVVPDLQKLMNYYLPMTVKLLNAYADMDAQPIAGETIQASKKEIEGTLDTLNLAFEKLLDTMFKDTAMDISSDITVLQTLLAQEGLTEDDLMKMKKQTAEEEQDGKRI